MMTCCGVLGWLKGAICTPTKTLRELLVCNLIDISSLIYSISLWHSLTHVSDDARHAGSGWKTSLLRAGVAGFRMREGDLCLAIRLLW